MASELAAEIAKLEEQLKTLQEEVDKARQELSRADPMLRTAKTQCIDACPSLADVHQLQGETRQHSLVDLVLAAVVTLLFGDPLAADWRHAHSQEFHHRMKTYPESEARMAPARVERIDRYIGDEEFDEEKVARVSLPASRFCKWVCQIYMYGRLLKSASFRRAAMQETQRKADVVEAELKAKRAKLSEPAEPPEAKASAQAAAVEPPAADVMKASPDHRAVVAKAVEALSQLDRKDIVEVKTYAKPPESVRVALEAVLVALGEKKHDWERAKKLLGDVDTFTKRLTNFDPQSLATDPARLQRLAPYVAHPKFDEAIVSRASKSAPCFVAWVKAVHAYALDAQPKKG